jgi:phosphoribosylformimino-5-aminoimidazole carboxamide ribotide isomerase
MSDWEIYPAIDLRGGRVVRLRQGDPARETVYDNAPQAAARRWQAAGARWLHIINLDGALEAGGGENLDALGLILDTGLQAQFGGGLRDLGSVCRVLEMGVKRAILGTAAVDQPRLVEDALAAFGPERVAVAIDAREGQVLTRGWQQASMHSAEELAQRCAAAGLKWIIHTDVARDGMGQGLNVAATRRLALGLGAGVRVIASGGVAGLDDVRRAHKAGLSGVIIGRALYDGSVDLQEALAVVRGDDAS